MGDLIDAYLERVFDFARRRRLPLSIHFAESAEETAFLDDTSGQIAQTLYPYVGWGDMLPPPARRSPVAYLADRRGLVPSTLLVHGRITSYNVCYTKLLRELRTGHDAMVTVPQEVVALLQGVGEARGAPTRG